MAIVLALAVHIPAATQAPVLRINAPVDGEFLSGPVILQAAVEPLAMRVARVSFFADGQLVCMVEARPFQCNWDAGEGVKAHTVRVVAELGDGARLVASVRTKALDYVEIVNVDAVQVSAVVKDHKGRFVTNLSRDSFRLLEEGVPQTIRFFAAENLPLELVVAVDISASMAGSIAEVKEAVKEFLQALRPGDAVTVMGFNDNFFTVARRETDPVTRAKAVDRLAPWGSTALYDAMMRSLDLLGRRQGKKAIVLFSDGDDQASVATKDDLVQAVQTGDAVIYAIGQGRALQSSEFKNTLDTLAEASGGRAFFVKDRKSLDETFAEIVKELSHQYLLGYTSTNPMRDGAWRRISVQVPKGEYRVRARDGYLARTRTPRKDSPQP